MDVEAKDGDTRVGELKYAALHILSLIAVVLNVPGTVSCCVSIHVFIQTIRFRHRTLFVSI